MSELVQVKIFETTHRKLKALSRRYALAMGLFIDAAINEVELEIGWEEVINRIYIVCPFCQAANVKTRDDCRECKKLLC